MTQKLKNLCLLASLLMQLPFSHAMMQEVSITDSHVAIEMDTIEQVESETQTDPASPSLLIEEPRPVNACCLSKRAILALLHAGCIIGIVLTAQTALYEPATILLGITEAVLCGITVPTVCWDIKSICCDKKIHQKCNAELLEQSADMSRELGNRTIPFEAVKCFNYFLDANRNMDAKDRKKSVKFLLFDETLLPATPTLTRCDTQNRTERFLALLLCLKRKNLNLARDIKYSLLANNPELICNEKLFTKVLPFVRPTNLPQLVTSCPISWFNYHYHTLTDQDKKEKFVAQSAHAMSCTEIALKKQIITSSAHPECMIPDTDKLEWHLYQNYKKQIVAPLSKKLTW